MIRTFLTGAGLGLGLWLLVLGLFPARPTLATRLSAFHDSSAPPTDAPTVFRTLWSRVALWLLDVVRGDFIDEITADVEVVGSDLRSHATDKLNAAIGGTVLVALVVYGLGIARSGLILACLVALGLVGCYFLPDLELKSKASTRRDEFNEALTGFVNLVSVSIAGGGGINSAMNDAAEIGQGWSFGLLRQCLNEAALIGEAPWTSFERTGRRLNLVSLVELSGALSLAGASGARITETLRSRAEADRAKEISRAMADAESKSESMNIPIAAMLLGWFGFMGYPAVANLVGG